MFSLLYAVAPSYQVMLALVLVHGVFWSGLLSSSSAYITDIVPKSRRAEGLGYSGFASILAIVGRAVDWPVGVRAWWLDAAVPGDGALNLIMALHRLAAAARPRREMPPLSLRPSDLVEWRVMVGAVTLFLYSFSYGGITSFVAVYADHVGVTPRALFFSVMAAGHHRARGRSSAAMPIGSATPR